MTGLIVGVLAAWVVLTFIARRFAGASMIVKIILKVVRVCLREIRETAIGAAVGWWWDRPALVRPRAVENPLELRRQVTAAVAWPVAAGWLTWHASSLIFLPVTGWATVVVMRRVMASRGHAWPWRRMILDARHWLLHHPGLIAVLAIVGIALPVFWTTTTKELPWVHAAPVTALMATAAFVAMREATWRTRVARYLPSLAQAHKVTEAVMERAILRPARRGKGFVMVVVPAAVVTHLDQLDLGLAMHLPQFEGVVDRGVTGKEAVGAITYRSTGVDTVETRDLLSRTGGLIVSLTPAVGPGNPARPDEHVAALAPTTSKTADPDVDSALRALGFRLVEWLPADGIAKAARLDPVTEALWEALNKRRPGRRWDREIATKVNESGEVVAVLVQREEATTPDPTRRREEWLRDIADCLPVSGDEGWVMTDLGEDRIKFERRRDPLNIDVPLTEDLGERITPDTPWRVGVDEDGNDILINLAASAHMLIAGATRSGKSVCTYGLISHVLRMGDSARLLVADPNDTTIAPFEPHVAWSTSSTHPDDVTSMLEWVRGEMDRRKPILRAMRADKIDTFTPDLPMIVVVIDEAANYLRHSDKNARAAMESELLAVVSQGAKYGVRLVLITQRPDSTILPTSTRAQLSCRISFRVEDKETALMAFPDLEDPTVLLTCRAGVGYMKEVAGTARRFRGVYMADHWSAAEQIGYTQPRIDVDSVFRSPIAAVAGEATDLEAPAQPATESVSLSLEDLEGFLDAEVSEQKAMVPAPDDLWDD